MDPVASTASGPPSEPAVTPVKPPEGEERAEAGSQPPMKQSTQPGAKTSDYYSVKNIPERFNNPHWFEGYNTKPQHPFFSPSSSVYGSKSPSVHTMPTQFHGRSQKFSKNLGKFGMYRNHSLNTAMDRSRV